jgi:hypothetical protein
MATCVARETTACENGASAPSTGVTADSINACATARASESCDDYYNNNPPMACHSQAGTLADGQPCEFNAQCSSAFCQIAKNAACGVCGKPAEAGASCATFGCDYGLNCVNKTQFCQPYGAAGAMCDSSTPCGHGLSCVGATATTKGTCQASGKTVGAACDPKAATAPGCDRSASLWCNATSKTCTMITTAMTGGSCGAQASGDYVVCAAGGFCNGGSATKAGTCVAVAADGATCDPADTTGPTCESPARCVTVGSASTCKLNSASNCGG